MALGFKILSMKIVVCFLAIEMQLSWIEIRWLAYSVKSSSSSLLKGFAGLLPCWIIKHHPIIFFVHLAVSRDTQCSCRECHCVSFIGRYACTSHNRTTIMFDSGSWAVFLSTLSSFHQIERGWFLFHQSIDSTIFILYVALICNLFCFAAYQGFVSWSASSEVTVVKPSLGHLWRMYAYILNRFFLTVLVNFCCLTFYNFPLFTCFLEYSFFVSLIDCSFF